MDPITLRRNAAPEMARTLDAAFFRALCEPVRIAILTRLIEIGRADVASIAEAFGQDRSVISRHLQMMKDAGVLYSEPVGRHVYYDIDGPSVLAKLRDITQRLALLV